MPTVPTLDPSQAVLPSQAPDVQTNSVVSAGLLNQGAATSTGQLGSALDQAASTQSQIASRMQDLANQTRVNDAVNQLKTQQQDLMYNPQTGIQSQTGLKALQRDSGMSLADEYAGKLSDSAAQISSSLSNPVQQRLFQQQASDAAAQLHGAATAWEGQQFKSYALSTQDGTIKNAANQVQLAYNDPAQIDQGLNAIKAATYQMGQINGTAATDIEANQRTATSMALTGAIDKALQAGQVTYAHGLVQQYGSDMTANDLLAVNGKMNTYLGSQAAMNTVTRVMTQAGPQLSNSPFDRMVAITLQSESGGKETAPDGSTLTSAKGAQGSMQVMPTTNTDPGFGVTPAQNNTPQERARVGRDYLQAMLSRYGGDPSKAWAAYNAGPGTLDAAVAQAQQNGTPGTWLTLMPQETQKYVASNVQAYQSGAQVGQRPSKLDVINQVRADPILQQKPEWMQQAVTLAGQQYDEQTAAIAQQDTANVAQVYRTLASNRGNIQSVDPSDLSKLQPDDMTKVLSFAKSMSEGTNATNTALYQTMITTPKIMSDMSNDQWQTQAPNFSVDDFKHLSQVRADLINNTGTNSPGSVNLRAINETLTQRLQTIGMDPFPQSHGFNGDSDAVARVGAIRQFVMQNILDAQKQAGKKFSEQEISGTIDGLFNKSVSVPNDGAASLWGLINRAPVQQNMLSMKKDDIPSNVVNSLTADFKAHGISNPSDGQLLGAYWKFQQGSKQ